MVPRKVILDVDPGIDDALALALALFDPRLEVVAVTAVAGNVPAGQATRNVQAIIEQLDPPRWPRIGAAVEPEAAPPINACHIHGADGLGNAQLQVAELHNIHLADKVLADEVRAAPDAVTIVALGPLSNIARAFRRDPALATQVGQIVMAGGTYRGWGNVTPAAEFNVFFDPPAAREVLRSPTTKTLVPLDVTSRVLMNYGHLAQLPGEATTVGRFLRKILPFAFRSHRQELGLEGIYVHDAVALAAVTSPELFVTERLPCDVETAGELTTGAVVFDGRPFGQWGHPVEVATEVDAGGVMEAILRSLNETARGDRQ